MGGKRPNEFFHDTKDGSLSDNEAVQFTTLWSTTIYITLPLGESSLSEERAMRVACIPSMALRIALSGGYRVRLSQKESE